MSLGLLHGTDFHTQINSLHLNISNNDSSLYR